MQEETRIIKFWDLVRLMLEILRYKLFNETDITKWRYQREDQEYIFY